MSKKYIEREALIDFANNHKGNVIDTNDIARFPAADVAEVRHGKWIKTSYPEVHRCNVCDKPSNTSKGLHKYCPNCGAKMDGGK